MTPCQKHFGNDASNKRYEIVWADGPCCVPGCSLLVWMFVQVGLQGLRAMGGVTGCEVRRYKQQQYRLTSGCAAWSLRVYLHQTIVSWCCGSVCSQSGMRLAQGEAFCALSIIGLFVTQCYSAPLIIRTGLERKKAGQGKIYKGEIGGKWRTACNFRRSGYDG